MYSGFSLSDASHRVCVGPIGQRAQLRHPHFILGCLVQSLALDPKSSLDQSESLKPYLGLSKLDLCYPHRKSRLGSWPLPGIWEVKECMDTLSPPLEKEKVSQLPTTITQQDCEKMKGNWSLFQEDRDVQRHIHPEETELAGWA